MVAELYVMDEVVIVSVRPDVVIFVVEGVDVPAEFVALTVTTYVFDEFKLKNAICLLNTLYVYNEPYPPETGAPLNVIFIVNDVAVSPPV